MAATAGRVLLLAWLLGAALGRQLICWQAMLQCQRESECSFAYRQYSEACAQILPRTWEEAAAMASPAASAHSGTSRRRCPSHCISALVYLNNTRGGPALEDCDCATDEQCRATKRAIEPCMPRTGGGTGGGSSTGGGAVMGCMEARRLCESDRRCHASLNRYLTSCGRLFNGVRCTEECRAVIEDMMRVPKALLLNDCVCDGQERPICESIKENMARLCFGTDMGNGGPGSSGGSDYYDDDEEYEEDISPGKEGSYEEESPKLNREPPNAAATPLHPLWTIGTCLLLLLLLG